jgi:hypothetical protein
VTPTKISFRSLPPTPINQFQSVVVCLVILTVRIDQLSFTTPNAN